MTNLAKCLITLIVFDISSDKRKENSSHVKLNVAIIEEFASGCYHK